MAGFQLTLYGRIWVTPEVQTMRKEFEHGDFFDVTEWPYGRGLHYKKTNFSCLEAIGYRFSAI
jgi:hypothetical protein